MCIIYNPYCLLAGDGLHGTFRVSVFIVVADKPVLGSYLENGSFVLVRGSAVPPAGGRQVQCRGREQLHQRCRTRSRGRPGFSTGGAVESKNTSAQY